MGAYLVAMRLKIFATASEAVGFLYLLWAIVFVFEIYSFLFLSAFQGLGRMVRAVRLRPVLQVVLSGVLAAVLTLYQLHRTQYYVVTEHVVPLPGLSEPVTILHVVDLHLGAFRGERFLRRIIGEVESRRPDIVIWNGDLASGNLALSESVFELFGGVAAEQYYTSGNHEYDVDTNRLRGLMERAGIVSLRSGMVETHGLQLIGLEYMNGDDNDFYDHGAKMVSDQTIAEVLPKIPRDRSKPTVLFHHSPVGLRHAAMGDVDVFLTGNTHAGQDSPLTSMFRLSHPVWPAGLVEVGHMSVLISQGGGNFGAWFRLGDPYLFQLVTLVPG
jgi:predicted MPP superfamily phosphohydrolase